MAAAQNLNLALVLLSVALMVVSVTAAPYESIEDDGELYDGLPLDKRPFCNAFAGCGRKRALLNQPISEGSAPTDIIFNKLPRLLNADSKAWEKLFSRLQQRQRLSFDSVKN